MSLLQNTPMLEGSMKNTKPLRECFKCGQKREQTGGVEMSPGKWRCASCWRGFSLSRK